MAANRITIYLTPDQLGQVDQLSHGLMISRAEWFRRLIVERLAEQKAPGQEVDPRPKKVRFLEAVAKLYHVSRAAKLVRATRAELAKWRSQQDFDQAVEDAQNEAVDQVEGNLMRCAAGELDLSKAAVTAAIAFLNAHHYAWGRVKVELLNRIVNPLVDLLLRMFAEELGEQGAPAVERVAQKFAQEKELRLAAFSE